MGFSLLTPSTVEEAVAFAAEGPSESSRILAGGTDLLRDLDEGRGDGVRVLSLRRLPWRTLAWTGDRLAIGSTLPLRTLEGDEEVRRRAPGLWTAVRAVGGVALRARATLGGNLARASPASDLIPILLAYDAIVRLVGKDGERTIPVDELIRGIRETSLRPGELIASVELPHVGPSSYVWQRVRPSNDISQVGVAVARPSGAARWQVALGGVTPRPVRLPPVEEILTAERPGEAEIARAAQGSAELAPFLSDKRATESYRRRLVRVLVARALRGALEANGPGVPA